MSLRVDQKYGLIQTDDKKYLMTRSFFIALATMSSESASGALQGVASSRGTKDIPANDDMFRVDDWVRHRPISRFKVRKPISSNVLLRD